MSRILVDSSVWISFFKGRELSRILMPLIDSNRICTNDLILAELVPLLALKHENHLIELLGHIEKIQLEIDWQQLIFMQSENLKNGINKVGLPDLIIIQNAVDSDSLLFTFDRHFELMKDLFGLKLYI